MVASIDWRTALRCVPCVAPALAAGLACAADGPAFTLRPSAVETAPGRPVTLEIARGKDDASYCAIEVDYGDGHRKPLRFEMSQATVTDSHAYEKAGRYTVTVAGRIMIRGFKTAFACSGDERTATLVVADPVAPAVPATMAAAPAPATPAPPPGAAPQAPAAPAPASAAVTPVASEPVVAAPAPGALLAAAPAATRTRSIAESPAPQEALAAVAAPREPAAEARNLAVAPPVRRIALVIGNSAYKSGPLANPVNDARAMSIRLKQLGFETVVRENLSVREIGGVYREFREKITPGSVALVFYAGHGVQFKGQNYFPAVDSSISGEEDVPLQSLNLGTLLDNMDEAKAGVSLVLLDACRDNPFARRFRSATRGLAKVEAASGTLIHYATKPGSVASDGEGKNGTYTEALLSQLGAPGVPVELLLKRVTNLVVSRTQGKQEPWVEGSLRGEFFFVPGDKGGAVATAAAATEAAPRVRTASEIEDDLWQGIKEEKTVEPVEEYLRQYPKGRYVGQARVLIARIKAAEKAAAEKAERAEREERLAAERAEKAERLAAERAEKQALASAEGGGKRSRDGVVSSPAKVPFEKCLECKANAKRRVAVVPVRVGTVTRDAQASADEISRRAVDGMEVQLRRRSEFVVTSRQDLGLVLSEQQLAKSQLTMADLAPKSGRVIPAELLLAVNIDRVDVTSESRRQVSNEASDMRERARRLEREAISAREDAVRQEQSAIESLRTAKEFARQQAEVEQQMRASAGNRRALNFGAMAYGLSTYGKEASESSARSQYASAKEQRALAERKLLEARQTRERADKDAQSDIVESTEHKATITVIWKALDSLTGEVIAGDTLTLKDSVVESRKVAYSGSAGSETSNRVRLEGLVNRLIDSSVEAVAARLAEGVEKIPFRGQIVKADKKEIVLNVGKSLGMDVGDTFSIRDNDKSIVDPATGRPLAGAGELRGLVRITEVNDKFSRAALIKEAGKIKRGDLLEWVGVYREAVAD